MNLPTIYVTVGTTKFDALIAAMGTPKVLEALKTRKCQKLVLQHGNSVALTQDAVELIKSSYSIAVEQYEFRPNINDIKTADLIIGHAGAGTCMDILNNGKPGLIVVNDELMDNHQLELAQQLAAEQYLYYCKVSEVQNKLKTLDFKALQPYKPAKQNMQKFVLALNELMQH